MAKFGAINSGPILAPQCLFESDSNNGPSLSHSNLVSDVSIHLFNLLVMISWWLLYMAKDSIPDFNYGPGNDSNSGCILALQHLIESGLNNGPSPSHSSLVSHGVIHLFRSPTHGFLVGTISAQGPQALLQ